VRAEHLVMQALAAAPRSAYAHYAKGQVLRAQRRYAEAIPEYETALAFDPNWVMALFCLGQCKIYTGSIEETIPLTERAKRLSPREPHGGNFYAQIGLVHLLQSRTDEAVIWLERTVSETPAHPQRRAFLAAAYALIGETERAVAELGEARRLLESRALAGRRKLGGAENPLIVRSHLFRRPSVGRHAGRMIATHKPENREIPYEVHIERPTLRF
jgi:tetratricopeptide (TPR) repeat protein